MNNYGRYIGMSLSFCVKDILNGKIRIEDISGIISSTKVESCEKAFEYYASYWGKFASKETCMETLKKVWPLVFQPRLNNNHEGHYITHGYWLDTQTGKLSFSPNKF